MAICLLPVDPAEGRVIRYLRTPEHGVDEPGLRALLRELHPEFAIIEHVGAMPGQGSVSGFTFGTSWGMIRGICVGLDIPYRLVRPQAWKKVILEGFDMGPQVPKAPKGLSGEAAAAFKKESAAFKKLRKQAQKDAAVEYVHRTFPSMNLIPAGARTENHNMAEAVCLAAFGVLADGESIHV